MAAVSNNVRNLKPERRLSKPRIETVDETVEISLQPEVLKRVMAAAKANGQSPGEWIREAVVEAVDRRTRERREHAGPKQ